MPAASDVGRFSPLFTWRSAVASANGPADVELDVERGDKPAKTTVKGATQRHVALTLSLHMNEKGSSCYPGVKRIAREAGVGERSVQRAVRALELGGWLAVQEGGGGEGTNLFTAMIPSGYVPDEGEGGGVPGTPGGAYRVRGGGVPGTPKDDSEDDSKVVEKSDSEVVGEAWASHAPPLILHPERVLSSEKVRRAVNGAVRDHGVEAVVAAVENYAAVLGDDGYVWSYRWTLLQFLQRGVDRFVPDADPLRNMPRTRAQSRPDLSELEGGGF